MGGWRKTNDYLQWYGTRYRYCYGPVWSDNIWLEPEPKINNYWLCDGMTFSFWRFYDKEILNGRSQNLKELSHDINFFGGLNGKIQNLFNDPAQGFRFCWIYIRKQTIKSYFLNRIVFKKQYTAYKFYVFGSTTLLSTLQYKTWANERFGAYCVHTKNKVAGRGGARLVLPFWREWWWRWNLHTRLGWGGRVAGEYTGSTSAIHIKTCQFPRTTFMTEYSAVS